MFKSLLESIVNDIILLYDVDDEEKDTHAFNKFMDAINLKIKLIKVFDYDLWWTVRFDCKTYKSVKEYISKYISEVL